MCPRTEGKGRWPISSDTRHKENKKGRGRKKNLPKGSSPSLLIYHLTARKRERPFRSLFFPPLFLAYRRSGETRPRSTSSPSSARPAGERGDPALPPSLPPGAPRGAKKRRKLGDFTSAPSLKGRGPRRGTRPSSFSSYLLRVVPVPPNQPRKQGKNGTVEGVACGYIREGKRQKGGHTFFHPSPYPKTPSFKGEKERGGGRTSFPILSSSKLPKNMSQGIPNLRRGRGGKGESFHDPH